MGPLVMIYLKLCIILLSFRLVSCLTDQELARFQSRHFVEPFSKLQGYVNVQNNSKSSAFVIKSNGIPDHLAGNKRLQNRYYVGIDNYKLIYKLYRCYVYRGLITNSNTKTKKNYISILFLRERNSWNKGAKLFLSDSQTTVRYVKYCGWRLPSAWNYCCGNQWCTYHESFYAKLLRFRYFNNLVKLKKLTNVREFVVRYLFPNKSCA